MSAAARKRVQARKRSVRQAAALDERPVADRVADAIAWLEQRGSKRVLNDMSTRYGIHTTKAFGVSVGTIQQLAKQLGRDHALAEALWQTGWYEARLLTAWVDEPDRVTSAQMDRWARDFDNWGVVDTVCFHLFDRTPHAWKKVEQWSQRREEFVKRAGFVLLACLAAHDRTATDAQFLRSLRLIVREGGDERNFVKKGVSWALRMIGRRNKALNVAAVETARTLTESTEPAARWVGKEALRELTSAKVRQQVVSARRGRLTGI
jgi:3-methyladenine DNA glycosylase AlkD